MWRYNFLNNDLNSFARGSSHKSSQGGNIGLNSHAYSICCRPEVAGCIGVGCDVLAVEGYVLVNFEVASYNIFRDNPDAEVGSGAVGINAICS